MSAPGIHRAASAWAKFIRDENCLRFQTRHRIRAQSFNTAPEDVMQVVTTSPLIKTYTLEEFWALPEPKDGSKLELIAGVLYMSPLPDFLHNISASSINRMFYLHLDRVGDEGIIFIPRAALWTY